MRLRPIGALLLAILIPLLLAEQRPVHGQGRVVTLTPDTAGAILDADNTVARMLRADELRIRTRRTDTLVAGRSLEWLSQYYQGVRVWGGEITRQVDTAGTAISVFGTVYAGITIEPDPAVTQDEAKAIIEHEGGAELHDSRSPELVVLPMDDGTFRLTWVAEVMSQFGKERIFIDAKTRQVALRYSTLETQVANAWVGHAVGVLNDDKKISTIFSSGTYFAADSLRPPVIQTYDMRADLTKAIQALNGFKVLTVSDIATDTDNDWTDVAVVDAHVYSSYTYDYYYKRFGRRGLNNADKAITNLVHLVRRSDLQTSSSSVVSTFFLNAAYVGDGIMFYGEGLPSNFFLSATNQSVNYFSGALDVVAHELTHGVTDYSSSLIYQGESGALNEAFSDIMGTSVEFFFQPAGTGLMKADYLIGEDVFTPRTGSISGIRSMADPAAFGDPDHYSKRYTGTADNGGVHTNSGIPNQAFYLAIEGGTNRTSGIRVTGVGGANRDQIEKIFYRGFVQLMPSNATFSVARATTLKAAQDLYGLNTASYNAVRDAWTAVGVN
jgi:thermolysin